MSFHPHHCSTVSLTLFFHNLCKIFLYIFNTIIMKIKMQIYVKDRQRKRLEGILNTEAAKKKRERLRNVLLQKLVVKYGTHNKMVISALVDQFLVEKDQIAPDDLARLEKEVVVALDARKVKVSNSSSSKLAKAGAAAVGEGNIHLENNSDDGNLVLAKNGTESNTRSTSSLAPPPPGSEWSVIQAYQLLQGEDAARKEREIEIQKKRDFRAALDKHVADAAKFKAEHSDVADAKYYAHIKQDIANYHEEERIKFEKIHAKAKEQLRIQNEQIAEKRRAKAAELDRQRLYEEQLLADARQKILEEKDKLSRMREQAISNAAKVNRENEENQRLKAIQAERDADEDRRLQAEYAAKLDKEDEERAQAFNKRMEKMAKFNEKFENEGAGNAIRQEQIRVERQLILDQQRKEAADQAAEEKKALQKKVNLQRMLAENDKILQRKAKEAEALRISDKHFAEAALADVEKYKQEQKARVEQVKAKHKVYRKVLDDQMKTRKPQADPASAAFLGREAELNQSLFDKAIHEPRVLKRLKDPVGVQQVKVVTHK